MDAVELIERLNLLVTGPLPFVAVATPKNGMYVLVAVSE